MNHSINWIINRPIAHRGLHDGNITIPENSLLSFEKAIEKNYPIEIDVRIIGDGTIIVFHDKNLLRTCGQEVHVTELSISSLKEYSLFKTEQCIPTLEETLELISDKVPLLIEIKNFTRDRRLEKNLVQQLTDYNGAFALQSFNPFSVKWLKKHSNFVVGQLETGFAETNIFKKIVNRILFRKSKNVDFVALGKKSLSNKGVAFYKSMGLPILCWTITNEAEEVNARKYCDNIIFEQFTPAHV